MSLVAGVDIGNATTEIVIVDTATLRPIAWDRCRTRGLKGSAEASRGAGRLLSRMQGRLPGVVACAILTHQTPVLTRRLDLPTAPVDTGRLRSIATPSATPGGAGFAVGRPLDVDLSPQQASSLAATDPVIAISRDPLGYRHTVAAVDRWLAAGVDVRGVLLAGDEASLVDRRLQRGLPIVDGADAQAALAAERIAIEVAEPGRTCRQASDPLRLAASLDLGPDEHAHASAMAASVTGLRSAAIARMADGAVEQQLPPAAAGIMLADGRSYGLPRAASVIESGESRLVGYLDDLGTRTAVSDLWLVDPSALAAIPGLRQPAWLQHRVALSTLDQRAAVDDHLDGMRSAWTGEVRLVGSEDRAALRGALSTPGVSPDALVVDLGGGTIDLVHASGPGWTGAGSGDLMTMATAIATDSSRAAAEWIKRGPAWRIEAPHLAIDESGDRRFLDAPAAQGSVGWLVTGGPSGELPFGRHLTGGEWRAIRLALKEQVFGRNTRRGLRALADCDSIGGPLSLSAGSMDVVLVGGPAGDEEIVEAMQAGLRDLPATASIGRADVAGVLGHRWAVAYGLVLLAFGDAPGPGPLA